jgi:DNA-directed RNA polymerase subunit RPC12/RpoP
MTYKCLNCGKETPGFNCDCGKDRKIWDSSLRKSHNKSINKKNSK